jgi:selenium-binding protein 1
MDANTFELKGQWEQDRGPQQLAYDFWWHLGHDTMITSEWGTPNMVKDGVNPELLLAGKYGHKIHIWDLDKRRHLQEVDLGAEQQWVLELRPPHDPQKTHGFVGVGVSLKDLSSIWMWYREDGGKNGKWAVRKVIEIPAEPADPEKLPPLLKGFKAVPPLVTDINLSLDDRFRYVSCWGTGEFIQYDVSDPANPCAARRFSCPSFFHPSTNRRMYKLLSNGLIGAPCGVPRPSSRLRVLRCLFPFSSVSSTGASSHILIRCSIAPSESSVGAT